MSDGAKDVPLTGWSLSVTFNDGYVATPNFRPGTHFLFDMVFGNNADHSSWSSDLINPSTVAVSSDSIRRSACSVGLAWGWPLAAGEK